MSRGFIYSPLGWWLSKVYNSLKRRFGGVKLCSRNIEKLLLLGKIYGAIYIDNAKSTLYSFYETYTQNWQECEELLCEYNDEALRYNREIAGKTYIIGSSELKQMESWETRLAEEGQLITELTEERGDFFPTPKGIVDNIFVRW